MARKGENIYKRKDGRWEGRYIKNRTNGKAHYGAVYAKSYKEVKEKLNHAKMKLPEFNQISKNNAGKLSDISILWLSEISTTLKESSIIKYEDLLRCYILPEFGDHDLSEITNEQLITFTNSLLTTGGRKQQGLASSTVAEIVTVINNIRLYALRRDYNVSFTPECITLKQEPTQIRIFSLEEERQLINYLKNNMDLTSLGILLCLFTGIRLGEICALNWDDICLNEHVIHITKTMLRLRIKEPAEKKTEVRIIEPKSPCSIRTIPLPKNISKLLQTYYTKGAFVLTGQKTKFIEPRTLQKRFKAILTACNIKDANFHAIRHTFATRCIELNFDVKSLSEILGHASVAITMNRYVHPSMSLKSQNMDKLSSLFAVK